MIEYLDRLTAGEPLSEKEYALLIRHHEDQALSEELFARARAGRERVFGKEVYIRGLIEFTNYCKNDCLYCGLRCSNRQLERYRLKEEEILSCCQSGYALGFRTFVLQGGEDPFFTDERMVHLISRIRQAFPDCALTLSIGEKSRESYRRYRQAGADRFLLRHETADEAHYRFLHPPALSWHHRMNCLKDLKELGYQVGCGFMVGSPGQTCDCLAKDMVFLRAFSPHMVGLGPFIPQHDTPFAGYPAGGLSLTLFMLALVRLTLPSVLLPATTALSTIHPEGRIRGILAGANVVMPNLSPLLVRDKYTLYDNKAFLGAEAAEAVDSLSQSMKSIGYHVVVSRGDHPSCRTTSPAGE